MRQIKKLFDLGLILFGIVIALFVTVMAIAVNLSIVQVCFGLACAIFLIAYGRTQYYQD